MSNDRLMRRLKVIAKTDDERDLLLLSKGNVAYRMEDLLKRRRNSALSGQHRETQRYDKEIMLLRAALGMPKMPPKEVVRTQRLAKDPVNGENLAISSDESATPTDIDWMKRVTSRGFAKVDAALSSRGYEYSSAIDGQLTHHTWKGYFNSQPDSLTVSMLGRNWAVAAVRNGHRVEAFDFAKSEDSVERGIPPPMTASQWDGTLSLLTKQAYASSWAKVVAEV